MLAMFFMKKKALLAAACSSAVGIKHSKETKAKLSVSKKDSNSLLFGKTLIGILSAQKGINKMLPL
jgi:hypothetical protein